MELYIFSKSDAVRFLPKKPTYAIRIISSWDDQERIMPLQDSEFYTRIRTYTFDDNDWYKTGPVWIDNDLAGKILKEFEQDKNHIESLMVHCTQGKNRSPAVAMALNEIFNLGCEHSNLEKRFPDFNHHTYKTLIEASAK